MNIKTNISFIRSILYLQAVIRSGTISRTAATNGIKAANLSKLLTVLETELGCKLLERNSRGVTPTKKGKRIYTIALELEHALAELENIRKTKLINPNQINFYISQDMKIDNIEAFSIKYPNILLTQVEEEHIADIAVLNHFPEDASASYTRCTIGNSIKQEVWITCNEKHPSAMLLYDFIIEKLLA